MPVAHTPASNRIQFSTPPDTVAYTTRTPVHSPAQPVDEIMQSVNYLALTSGETALETFITERGLHHNQMRLNVAFSDKPILSPKEIAASEQLQKEFLTWLKTKLPANTFILLKQALITGCAINEDDDLVAEDIPLIPVMVRQKLYCLTFLTRFSTTKHLNHACEVFVPHTGETVNINQVQPAFASQSIIERLMVRIKVQ